VTTRAKWRSARCSSAKVSRASRSVHRCPPLRSRRDLRYRAYSTLDGLETTSVGDGIRPTRGSVRSSPIGSATSASGGRNVVAAPVLGGLHHDVAGHRTLPVGALGLATARGEPTASNSTLSSRYLLLVKLDVSDRELERSDGDVFEVEVNGKERACIGGPRGGLTRIGPDGVHRSKCQLHVSPYRREDNAGSWAVSAIAHVALRVVCADVAPAGVDGPPERVCPVVVDDDVHRLNSADIMAAPLSRDARELESQLAVNQVQQSAAMSFWTYEYPRVPRSPWIYG
jgi:hypothetical protein